MKWWAGGLGATLVVLVSSYLAVVQIGTADPDRQGPIFSPYPWVGVLLFAALLCAALFILCVASASRSTGRLSDGHVQAVSREPSSSPRNHVEAPWPIRPGINATEPIALRRGPFHGRIVAQLVLAGPVIMLPVGVPATAMAVYVKSEDVDLEHRAIWDFSHTEEVPRS